MANVPVDILELDDEPILVDSFDLDSDEEHPRPETADPQGAEDPTQDTNIGSKTDSRYLVMAKKAYGPLGAPEKFIDFAAAAHMYRDALKDVKCNTPSRQIMVCEGLSSCVDAALTELVVDMSLEINQVSALALEIRGLTPEVFDAWVHLQFTVGRLLAMLTAKRKGSNVSHELHIEEELKEGRLIAGAITSTAPQFENFVGIARLTLEQDLNIKTLDEQMELDLALNDFITARRITFMAQSLFSPAGPRAKDLAEGLKLLNQARTFDKNFQVTIDRIRTRNRRKLKTVQLAVEKRVTVSVTATHEELDERTAMSA